MTASDRSPPDSPHGLLGGILAALPGLSRFRRPRVVSPAPTASPKTAASPKAAVSPEPAAGPEPEEIGWPTWRTPR